MKIKTVRMRLDNSEDFDEEVNNALADGWILKARYTLNPQTTDKHIMLIAELEKEDE